MEAKNLVDQIFTDKAKNDSNSNDLARTLDLLSKTVFGEVNRFVFELLQNADDAATKNGKQIDVQFRLLDNYIIFSHDGEHFDANDVRGISSVASRLGNKDKEEEKTGYKGIGFKSIFGSATYAHIISGPFSFRFDKQHDHWNGQPELYPWQVIPIWTDEPVDEVRSRIDRNRVITIINVPNRVTLKREILKVFDDCQIILFLRRVARVTFYDHDEKVLELEKRTLTKGIIELYKNDSLHSSWKVDSFEIPIPENVSTALKTLGESECPRKLKDATRTKLTFAAPIKDGKISTVSEAVLYSYLPTNSSFKFGFLINGDFLMDAQRTGLLQVIWNDFLFERIAELHIRWILELQKEEYRFDILKLLRGNFSTAYNLKSFQIAYNNQLMQALKTIPFILDKKEENYHKLYNCIVDEVHFSEFFPVQSIRDFLDLGGNYVVVNYSYQNTIKLVELGAKSFGQNEVFMMIEKKFFSGWNESYDLSSFLFFGAKNFNSITWDKNCASAGFLADEEEVLRSPKDIFFPFKKGEELPSDIDRSELHFVHNQILETYDRLGAEDLVDWLHSMGVREPTEREIAKKSILPMITKDSITAENSLNLTRLLVRVHSRNEFDISDYETLNQLKLITSQGLNIANKCYLPVQYGGDQELERILPNSDFVSTKYTEDIAEEDIPHFVTFFKKIGCSSTITVVIIEESIEVGKLENRFPASTAFFDWLESTNVIPNIYWPYRSSQHKYSGYTRVDFRSQLHDFFFAKYFWSGVLNNWDVFHQKVSDGRYYVRNNSFSTASFIQYYAMEQAVVPCTDGQCRPGKQVFAPSLKNIVGNYFPVADFPSTISAAQRDFFALRKTIGVDECLELLTHLSTNTITPDLVKQVHSIYGQLVGMGIQNDPEKCDLILKWKSTGNLLAANNTFQDANNLWFFNVLGLEISSGSAYFLKLPTVLEEGEKLAFCELFQIPIITVDKLEFLPICPLGNMELPNTILDRVSHFAILYSSITLENVNDVFQKMVRIVRGTNFYQAENLSFIFKNTSGQVLYENSTRCTNIRGDGFYFVGKWFKPRALFEICGPLCELLSLKGLTREVQLLMQLNDNDARDWLIEHGHSITFLDEGVSQLELFDVAQTELIDQEVVDFEYDNIAFRTETFEPVVQPNEIDLNNITPVSKVYPPDQSIIVGNYKRPSNPEFTSDVGFWSEQFVNSYLLANSGTFTDVIWVNENGESNLPYDFECLENGKKLFIDSKGTPSATKSEIYLSTAEWRFIFEKGEQYSLFRVFRAGFSDAQLERIDNVSKKITNAEVLPNPVALIV